MRAHTMINGYLPSGVHRGGNAGITPPPSAFSEGGNVPYSSDIKKKILYHHA